MVCFFETILLFYITLFHGFFFRFFLQKFVYVNSDELKFLQNVTSPEMRSSFDRLVKKNPTCLRLVPKYSGNVLRIKLVESFDGIVGHQVSFGDWKYVFSQEGSDVVSSPGVLVSCWWKCPSVKHPRISNEEARHWIDCYGKGFGRRKKTDSFGLNVYTDDEGTLSHRPHPGVFTDVREIPFHQFKNKNFEFPLMRSCLEKRLHVLTASLKGKASLMHPGLMDIIGGSCTKRIVTTGFGIRRRGKPSNKYGPYFWYSFVNQIHCNSCDQMDHPVKDYFREKATTEYKRRLLECPDVPLPTTCGYQISWKEGVNRDKFSITQFFTMEGLGLTHPIEDGICHHFLASMFWHNTTMAVLTNANGDLCIGTEDPILLIFAWGSSGGPANVRAAAARRRSDRLNQLAQEAIVHHEAVGTQQTYQEMDTATAAAIEANEEAD